MQLKRKASTRFEIASTAAMAQHRGRRGLRRPVDAVDAVVAAYARSDLFAKRRSLMEQWEAWCVGYLAPATDQERLLNGG